MQAFKDIFHFGRWRRQIFSSKFTTWELAILITRILLCVFSLASGLVLAVGPLHAPKYLYLGRFDTGYSNIAKGLYLYLKQSVESVSQADFNDHLGLTSSELDILTRYAMEHIEDLPLFITTSIYGNCKTISKDIVKHYYQNTMYLEYNNLVTQCERNGLGNVFDYREILSDMGLSLLLSYAYRENYGAQELQTKNYETFINFLGSRRAILMVLIFIVCGMEVVSIFLTFIYTFIKGRFLNLIYEELLIQTLCVLSLIKFITGCVSSVMLTVIELNLRGRIHGELSLFGISYHIGAAWYITLYFFLTFLSASCLLWSGVEWCVARATDLKPNEMTQHILNTQREEFELVQRVDDKLDNTLIYNNWHDGDFDENYEMYEITTLPEEDEFDSEKEDDDNVLRIIKPISAIPF